MQRKALDTDNLYTSMCLFIYYDSPNSEPTCSHGDSNYLHDVAYNTLYTD